MKTENLSSEKNGISIAVKLGKGKPAYLTPEQLVAVLTPEVADKLRAELASVDTAELAAITQRANQTPEARALARVTAQRATLEAAVAATGEGSPERLIAEMKLKVFELEQASK